MEASFMKQHSLEIEKNMDTECPSHLKMPQTFNNNFTLTYQYHF